MKRGLCASIATLWLLLSLACGAAPTPDLPTTTPIPLATTAPSVIGATATTPQEPSPETMTEVAVVRVIDGDTIKVDIGGMLFSVRYIGINCPESDQPGGSEATEANRQLVEGQLVKLEKDVSDVDRYGRLLRYVYVGELFVNAELVALGYAQAATYPPDVAFADLFVDLEREAREGGRGLWAQATVAAPTATSPQPQMPTTSPASPEPSWDCSGDLYNCGDFSSCADVMSYWNACPGDPSKLDQNQDGEPCESLCQ